MGDVEYSVTLGLTTEGKLMLPDQSGHWETVNFNENYAGDYPAYFFPSKLLY